MASLQAKREGRQQKKARPTDQKSCSGGTCIGKTHSLRKNANAGETKKKPEGVTKKTKGLTLERGGLTEERRQATVMPRVQTITKSGG